MKTISILAASAALLLCACGGSDGSGVDGGKALISLSAGEQMDLCEYIVASGPSEPVDCGDGVTAEPTTVSECVADFSDFTADCTATVAQAEACAEAIGADPCGDSFPAECAWVFDCVEL